MTCATCNSHNPPGSKFCLECGGRLAGRCARCAAELPPAAKFCNGCGSPVGDPAAAPRRPPPDPRTYTPRHLTEKILTSRAALEGERKQVTILFVDIKESMALAEETDPEEWHRILDRFFAILSEGVHRFEGTINQFTGDGVMALFGAPIAHEDHAVRACYAALHLNEALRHYGAEIRRTRGLSFAVRMGLNSGEVVVGKIGDDLRMDYTAQGHVVGLAARMEQLAEPGTTYVAEDTARLVEGFFSLRDLGVFTIKGVRNATRVYQLQGVGTLRTRLERARARGFSRFVGRSDEMAVLGDALAQAMAGGGRVVGIVAEPGVGKSRLCHELGEQARARRLAVHECRCVSYGRMLPFLPILELLRSLLGLDERDASDVARQKIAGALLLADDTMRASLPFLFEFLGIPDPTHPAPPMMPEARQQQLFTVVRRLLESSSRGAATVVLCEDLHWIDGGSANLLDKLIELIPATRTLFLVNFRPEYEAPWARAEAGVRARYTELQLQPLSLADSDELLRELLGNGRSLEDLRRLIRERTGGNPFFIEEVVRALEDEGVLVRAGDGDAGRRGGATNVALTQPVTEITIPATVHAVLAARIDRLGEHEKQILQIAAVIGKEVPEPLLRHVLAADGLARGQRESEPVLALIAARFLFEKSSYPDRVYAFQHPLTQEVAYRSLLGDRRRRVHAAVARAIADTYSSSLDERAALLAHHWESAGEALEAARCHRRAAAWAGGVDAAESLTHLKAIGTLVEQLPRSPETVALALDVCQTVLRVGPFVGMSTAEATRFFEEGRRLATENGDQTALAKLFSSYGYFRSATGDIKDARRYVQEAAGLGRDADDPALRLGLLLDDAQLCLWDGRLVEGVALMNEAAELVGKEGALEEFRIAVGLSGEAFVLAWRGLLRSMTGQLREATDDLARAVALAQEMDAPEGLCLAYALRGVVAWSRGDGPATLADAHAALEIAGRLKTPYLEALGQLLLGAALVGLQRWADAHRTLEQVQSLGSVLDVFRQPLLAEAYLRDGRLAEARALTDQTLRLARENGNRLMEAFAQRLLAEVLVNTEGLRAAASIEEAIAAGLANVEACGAATLAPFFQIARANLAALRGDLDLRARELQTALRQFVAIGATGHAQWVTGLLESEAQAS